MPPMMRTLLEAFKKRRVAIVSAAESIDATTRAGQALVGVIGVFAQWEREAIGERIAAALQHKRSSGDVYGSTPYGFERDGDRLVPAKRELEVVRRIHRMHRKGLSLHAIARNLNDGGVPTKNRRPWAASTVRYVLNNDLYAKHLKGVKR